jgi:hypothetical protein
MGRMHISALMCHVDDLDHRVQREGEFVTNVLTGWNFGDGHCLDERLIQGVQERCNYEPGDLVIAFTESQPAFTKIVQYRVIDAALGTVEIGWYHNDDAYNTQPWLPDGPIPHTVTWRMPGYEPRGVPHPGSGGRTAKRAQGSRGMTWGTIDSSGPTSAGNGSENTSAGRDEHAESSSIP